MARHVGKPWAKPCPSLLLLDRLTRGNIPGSNCYRKMRVCKSFLGTNENQKTDMASLLAFRSLPGFPLGRNPQDSPNLIYSFPETSNTGKGCQWEIQSGLLPFSPVPFSVGKQSC